MAVLRRMPRREDPAPVPPPEPRPPREDPGARGAGRDDVLEALRADARYHRERRELYRARSYGMRPTSASRMRELERASAQADERLARAERARAHIRLDKPPQEE